MGHYGSVVVALATWRGIEGVAVVVVYVVANAVVGYGEEDGACPWRLQDSEVQNLRPFQVLDSFATLTAYVMRAVSFAWSY